MKKILFFALLTTVLLSCENDLNKKSIDETIPTVTNLTIESGHTSLTLKWDDPIGSDITSIIIVCDSSKFRPDEYEVMLGTQVLAIDNLNLEEYQFYVYTKNSSSKLSLPIEISGTPDYYIEEDEFESNNVKDDASSIMLGELYEMSIYPANDKDIYSFNVIRDKYYLLYLNQEMQYSKLITLKVYDDENDVVLRETTSHFTSNSGIMITPHYSDRFFLEIVSENGQDVMHYDLQIDEGFFSPDSYETNDTKASATPMTFGTITGNLHSVDDEDYYSFYGTAGEKYHIEVSDVDQYDYVFQADTGFDVSDESDIIQCRDSGFGQAAFECTESGTYFIVIRNGSSSHELGHYSLKLTAIDFPNDVYEEDNSYAQATPIAINELQEHTINTHDDEDWFKVYLESGKAYRFDTRNTDYFYLRGDSRLVLYHSDGVTEVEDSFINLQSYNGYMLWRNCTSSGYYYVKVFSGNKSISHYGFCFSYDE